MTATSIFPDSQLDTIENDRIVVFHYELTDEDGDIIESSLDDEPIPYLHGHENIVSGLEKALSGKKVGDKFTAVIPPEEGYGTFNEDEELIEVPRETFPADMPVGLHFPITAELDNGELTTLYIADFNDDTIFFSEQHPLAGETLHYAVEICGVREATPEELEHGHAHGIDGTEIDDEEDDEGGCCGEGGCGCGGH